jgi:hypothetical protein
MPDPKPAQQGAGRLGCPNGEGETVPDDVGQVADELEIRNLVGRMAQLADSAPAEDLGEYASLFTEDAHWEMPGSAFDGVAAIVDGAKDRRASGTQGPGTHTRHVITNHAVSVEGPDATGRAYFMLVAGTDVSPQVRMIGQYDDRYQRTSDGWKLARRTISLG